MEDPAATLALSAMTAGFVTLLIEYAAKPRLDARKERILERHRSVRHLQDAIRLLTARLGKLTDVTVWQHGPGTVFVGEAIQQVRDVEHRLMLAGDALPEPVLRVMSYGVGAMLGILVSYHGAIGTLADEGRQAAAEAVSRSMDTLTPAFDYVLSMRPWYRVARWRFIRQVREVQRERAAP
jgi:hypothetical protein